MTEPVLQGMIERGLTEVIVLPPIADAPAAPSIAPKAINTARLVSQGNYDVDENFLAASIMGIAEAKPDRIQSSRSSDAGLTHPSNPGLIDYKGKSVQALDRRSGRSGEVAITALRHRVHSASLQPSPEVDEDSECQAFVSTGHLGRLGLFSGNYVRHVVVQTELA